MDLKKKWDKRMKAGKGEQTDEDDIESETEKVLIKIGKDFEKRNQSFWYSCLAVDEGEWDEVHEAICDLVEDMHQEGEKGQQRHSEQKKTRGLNGASACARER